MIPAYDDWARSAASYFSQFGIHPGFAYDVARLYVYTWAKGLNPRFTSVFRDPSRQAFLRAEYDAGRGAQYGLRVRPAVNSKHSTLVAGKPAALAVDMPTSDDRAAAKIASDLGIGAGLSFQTPDPGHYYSLKVSI